MSTSVILLCACLVAGTAATRSTWSPCGWSMLSTLTPLTERGRNHRFGTTAAWFIAGATLGGAALGSLGALGAALVAGSGLGPTARLAAAAVAVAAAVGFDTAVLGPALPHHRRQVDERWLDEYRRWIYAGGFGAQIGAGLATYIMTAGVYLVVVLGALSARPLAAFGVAVLFGTLRGTAVLSGWRNTSPQQLLRFHRRFALLTEPVRRFSIGVEVAAGSALIATLALRSPGVATGVGLALSVAAAVAVATTPAKRQARLAAAAVQAGTPQTVSMVTPPSAAFSSGTSVDRRVTEPTTA